MVELIVHTPDNHEEILDFDAGEYSIGRVDTCDVVLPHGKVSRHHATLRIEGSTVLLEDAGSANGTFLNGERLNGPRRLRSGDRIGVADYVLTVKVKTRDSTKPGTRTGRRAPAERAEAQRPVSVPARRGAGPPTITDRTLEAVAEHHESDVGSALDDRRQTELSDIRREIHVRLLEYLDLRKLDFNKVSERDIREKVRSLIKDIIIEMGDRIPSWANKSSVAKEVLDEALGLGPLEDFLADPSITEVMVNSKDQIYFERKGVLHRSDKRFTSNESLMGVIERIVAPLGRRIDESSPMVDARLKDGSRVNAIIPPLALKGPSLTIRKFAEDPYMVDDLVGFGTLTRMMADFLRACVAGRKNLIISGGTGSGKTTLLNVVSGFIPAGERIITIEDAAELQLSQPHVVSLESRPPNIEGKGAITIRDLVKNSLRMRPDRIVVGECRGAEALDMLQAMNTGHDGSLTTGHANSPRDILSRLETMVLMGGIELPVQAIRDQIASAVDIIVQQARFSDGTRKITHISEIVGLDEDLRYQIKHLFLFQQEGIEPGSARVLGRFVATGEKPSFLAEFRARDIPLDESIFEPAPVPV
jgi:pilus assembly protein CpaF